MGVKQEGFKDLTPEKALIASKVRGRKSLVGAMSPDFCQSGVGAGTQYLAGLNPPGLRAAGRSTLAHN